MPMMEMAATTAIKRARSGCLDGSNIVLSFQLADPSYDFAAFPALTYINIAGEGLLRGRAPNFIDWSISKDGQTAIADFKNNNEQLFFPNADVPRA
jgi:hypothetical protein